MRQRNIFSNYSTQFSQKRPGFWRCILRLCGLVLLVIVSYYGYWYATGNIHTVIPGQIIRSANLTPKQLQQTIKDYHIRSIINLAPNGAYYQDELKLSQSADIKHMALPLYAHGLASIEDLKRLAQLLEIAPRPVLIHCIQGADRTGLGSAMALALTPYVTATQIQHQYSVFYGAIAPDSVGRVVMKQYFAWLHQKHLQTSPEVFLMWLQQLQVGPNYPYDPHTSRN